jgi:hypothetical protein
MTNKLPGRRSRLDVLKRGARAKVAAKAKEAAKVVARNSAVNKQAATNTKQNLTAMLTIANGKNPTPTLEVSRELRRPMPKLRKKS